MDATLNFHRKKKCSYFGPHSTEILAMSMFVKFTNFTVDDGTRIELWHDLWCGGQPLREGFLELFRIARNTEALVADHLLISRETHHWDIHFVKTVQDWELESVVTFMELLYSCSVRQNGVNNFCWTPPSRKAFKVKSNYTLSHPSTQFNFLWNSVWKPKVQTKVDSFLWTAALGKILTIDNLGKWQVLEIFVKA